jgi:hypothetical protein
LSLNCAPVQLYYRYTLHRSPANLYSFDFCFFFVSLMFFPVLVCTVAVLFLSICLCSESCCLFSFLVKRDIILRLTCLYWRCCHIVDCTLILHSTGYHLVHLVFLSLPLSLFEVLTVINQ